MVEMLMVTMMAVAAIVILCFSDDDTKHSRAEESRLAYEKYLLNLEAMDACRKMLDEAMRQPITTKNDWNLLDK